MSRLKWIPALLARREAGQDQPIVMSDALAANQRDDDDTLIRCHCLAHGRRQFTDLDEVFPDECTHIITVLNQVFEPEAVTRDQAMTAAERLAYHQTHSGPLLAALHDWLEQQFQDRTVEPNSSLGKAFAYLLNRWETLTQFLRVAASSPDSWSGWREIPSALTPSVSALPEREACRQSAARSC